MNFPGKLQLSQCGRREKKNIMQTNNKTWVSYHWKSTIELALTQAIEGPQL